LHGRFDMYRHDARNGPMHTVDVSFFKKIIILLMVFLTIASKGHTQTQTLAYGRLCNQLFRNLCVSLIAKKHNLSVSYSSFDTIQELGIELFVGANSYQDTTILHDYNFFDLLNTDYLTSDLDPNGSYFQTKEISNYIFQYLRQEEIKNHVIHANPFNYRYNKNNDCFIHIRLTDTEQWNPGEQYYLKALSLISFNKLYIASDDIHNKIVKRITKKHRNAVLLNLDEIRTIQFGSTCKNIILSHGSFSATIGFLSFFSDVYYKKYEEHKIWYGDMFSIPGWNMIE